MKAKLGEVSTNRTEGPARRSATVAVSRLALEALMGKDEPDLELASARMVVAIRFYLGDRGAAGRPAWPYPDFLRGSKVQEDVAIKLEIDDGLWRSFEAEAAEQDISVQQLVEHASFYLAAEIDAGRVTQRILADLAMKAEEAGAEEKPDS